MLRGGVGEFYDRVPLMIPAFQWFPERTVFILNPGGPGDQLDRLYQPDYRRSAQPAKHRVEFGAQPKGLQWTCCSRWVTSNATPLNDFVVSTVDGTAGTGLVTLSNNGGQSYKELQVTGRYQFRKHFINASYVHSRAYGDLNDFFQFFGNVAKPVIQPNGQGRLPFDAPNRFLLSGEFQGPWKLLFAPVLRSAHRISLLGAKRVSRICRAAEHAALSSSFHPLTCKSRGPSRYQWAATGGSEPAWVSPPSTYSITSIRAMCRPSKRVLALVGSSTTRGANIAGNSLWSSNYEDSNRRHFIPRVGINNDAHAQQAPILGADEVIAKLIDHNSQRDKLGRRLHREQTLCS